MNSIRRRLTVGLLIGFCLLWIIGGTALYLTIRAGLVVEFDDSLRATAEGLSAATEQDKGSVNVDFVGDLMPSFERRRQPDAFQVWLADNTTIKRSPSLKGADLPNRVLPSTKNLTCWNLVLPDGLPGRAIGIRFVPQLEEAVRDQPTAMKLKDPITLVVARHRAPLDYRVRLIATAILLVGGALVVMAGFGVPAIVGRSLRPLERLAEHVATIEVHSLESPYSTHGLPAELLPICQQLNELLARLQSSFERERRFSADVAHELRTPIAELRTLAEVALKWPEDSGTTRSTFQDALAIALQMGLIADGLLAIARREGGLLPVQVEPVRLAQLIEEISESLADEARKKQIMLAVVAPDGTYWLTDSTLLCAILTNLLSNAVQYCATGGTIRLSVQTDGERGQLRLSNTTDDLSADDLPHLFERFWRKDPSRSSSRHCGLGLALCKAYAEALTMDLHAELTNPQEITFILSRRTDLRRYAGPALVWRNTAVMFGLACFGVTGES